MVLSAYGTHICTSSCVNFHKQYITISKALHFNQYNLCVHYHLGFTIFSIIPLIFPTYSWLYHIRVVIKKLDIFFILFHWYFYNIPIMPILYCIKWWSYPDKYLIDKQLIESHISSHFAIFFDSVSKGVGNKWIERVNSNVIHCGQTQYPNQWKIVASSKNSQMK